MDTSIGIANSDSAFVCRTCPHEISHEILQGGYDPSNYNLPNYTSMHLLCGCLLSYLVLTNKNCPGVKDLLEPYRTKIANLFTKFSENELLSSWCASATIPCLLVNTIFPRWNKSCYLKITILYRVQTAVFLNGLLNFDLLQILQLNGWKLDERRI